MKGKAYSGYKFLRLQPLDRYIPDFICKELKIIIEVEGDTHDLKYDDTRYEQLKKLGYKVIRFTNSEIKKDLKKVLQRIYDYAEDYTR